MNIQSCNLNFLHYANIYYIFKLSTSRAVMKKRDYGYYRQPFWSSSKYEPTMLNGRPLSPNSLPSFRPNRKPSLEKWSCGWSFIDAIVHQKPTSSKQEHKENQDQNEIERNDFVTPNKTRRRIAAHAFKNGNCVVASGRSRVWKGVGFTPSENKNQSACIKRSRESTTKSEMLQKAGRTRWLRPAET